MTFKQKYIGDRKFYHMLLVLIVPIVVQQGITNFVSLLDNLMVGALGTIQMSAVSIVNQLIFVFNLAIFGGMSGAAIFGTQFFGAGNWSGMRDTFRFKMYFSLIASAVAVTALLLFDDELIMLFLKSKTNSEADIAAVLMYAKSYLKIAVIGLLPFAVVQTYAETLRETGETVMPMKAGCITISVNVVFNYLLIYGKFGFPQLGVVGAAVATVMSRFVELIFIVAVTHIKRNKYKFIIGAYRSFRVPAMLVKKIAVTGTPLLINEIMWSLGQTFINQNYAIRGISVIAATNITMTAWNLFCVIMFALGSAVSILVGQRLGANDRDGAIDVDRKLLFVTLVLHVGIAGLIIASAPFIPRLYNVEPEVKALATQFLILAGLSLPIHSVIHTIYFTIRSGGKTIITFLFDSVFTWIVPAMLSFFLCRYTTVDIILIYFIVQFSETVKLFVGIPMLKNGFWANCVISDIKPENGVTRK